MSSRIKQMSKVGSDAAVADSRLVIDFSNHGYSNPNRKDSDLHVFRAHPIPDGNRAERREYKKQEKKLRKR